METLTFGCAFSDRIEALLDGRVQVEGFQLDITLRQPQVLFREVLKQQAYDIAEMSLGSHIANVAAGIDDYVALPIFLSRAFRHSNIYVRTDRIRRPQDLAGCTFGVGDYRQTATIWVRGILADDYGVSREDLSWVVGGLNVSATESRGGAARPNARVRQTTDSLDALIRKGEIDAIISPVEPLCANDPDVPVGRLFPDVRAIEADYFLRTGVFPLMHCLVVRRTVLRGHPTLAPALMKAFDEALALALRDLDGRDYPKVAAPWISSHRSLVRSALGREPWTYGLADNVDAISALLRYAYEDGITPLQLSASDILCDGR